MKNQVTLWLLLFFVFFTTSIFAQEKGLIVLLIKPYDSLVKIDNKIYDLSKEPFPFELELPEGQYEAQIWAPNYNIHTINLDVKANRPIQIAKQLDDFTETYQDYQKEIEVFKTNTGTDRFLIAANIGATLGYTLFLLKSKKDLNKRFENVEVARDDYKRGVAIYFLRTAQDRFNFQRNKFEKQEKTHNAVLIAGGIGLGVIYGLSARYFKKRKGVRKEKPTYKAQNPFANISFDISPGLTIIDKSAATKFGLTWTF